MLRTDSWMLYTGALGIELSLALLPKLDSVYGCVMPPSASGFLAVFSFVNLDIFSVLPFRWGCIGLGGYHTKLLAAAIAPLILIAVSLVIAATAGLTRLRGEESRSGVVREERTALLKTLSLTLRVTSLAFPAVSSMVSHITPLALELPRH